HGAIQYSMVRVGQASAVNGLLGLQLRREILIQRRRGLLGGLLGGLLLAAVNFRLERAALLRELALHGAIGGILELLRHVFQAVAQFRLGPFRQWALLGLLRLHGRLGGLLFGLRFLG